MAAVPPDAAERAAALLSEVATGKWDLARAEFDDTMAHALDDDELATVWARVTVQAGRYQGIGQADVTSTGRFTNVVIPLTFDDSTMYGQVTFDADGKVAGLHFLLDDPKERTRGTRPAHMILRCADGHLYTATMDALLYRSIHFWSTQFRPCPVDRKWRTAKFVDANTLTRQELDEAAKHSI
jgi:hypothetical protein